MIKISKYVYERLRRRPLCALCMLFILLVLFYNNSSFYKKGQAVYQPRGRNYFTRMGIEDGELIRLTGRIRSLNLRDINGRQVQVAMLDRVITTDGERLTSPFLRIQVYFSPDDNNKIGQTVEFRGELAFFAPATNSGEFDAYEYYRNIGTMFRVYDGNICKRSKKYSYVEDKLYRLRLTGEGILQQYLGEEDSAIMKAMIFGNKSEISEEVKDLFRKNGIAHILAISGLHISLIAMGLYKILKRTGLESRLCAFISMFIIVLYGIMVGFPVSAFRAIVMFGLYLLSKVLLRTYDMMTAMSVALTMLLLSNPRGLMDTGLQLSFMAIIAVGFVFNQFSRNVWKSPIWLNSFFISMFVFITTMPVILSKYYEIAMYSIILNLIIIPLMSILMISGIGIVLLGKVACLKWLANVLTYIVSMILSLYKGTCSFLTEHGMGRINMGVPGIWRTVSFYIIILVAVCIRFKKGSGVAKRLLHFACCIAVALLLLMIRPHSGMRIWMLDVGQGDGMVIENDKGHIYVIDGGSTSKKNVGERIIIPMLKYYGINEIEGIFITHPDEDHMNGVRELMEGGSKENLKIRNLYIYEGFLEDEGMQDILALAKTGSVKINGVHRGQAIKDGRLNIRVLYPYRGKAVEDANSASLVMQVEYEGFSMLTTGDVTELSERELIEYEMSRGNNPDKVEVLKVAHHGSSTSSSAELLNWARPDIALISVGKGNSYGHPHEETLDRIKEHVPETGIYRTDECGQVNIRVKNGKDSGKIVIEQFVR